MKNTIKFLALLFLITFVACDKDSALDEEDIQNEDLSGESLPEIYTGDDSHLKLELSEKEQLMIDEEESVANSGGDYEFKEDLSRARRIEPIRFGQTIRSSTYGQGNSIHSRGNDRIYSFTLNRSTSVKIALSDLHSDIDLYLYRPSSRPNRWIRVARSTARGNANERIGMRLAAGKYYIVVEGYYADGHYTLSKHDLGGGTGGHACTASRQSCSDFEGSSPYRGISAQSRNWRKWTSSAADGEVKYENAFFNNKVIKFDYRRYGRQDVVRALDNNIRYCGSHEMSFKLYKMTGKKVKFASIKSSSFTNSNLGFLVDILENGQIVFRNGNQTRRSGFRVPNNEWVKVHMKFDLDRNKVEIDIISSIAWTNASFRASSIAFSRYARQKSIWGINFYADNTSVKYHIDNICTNKRLNHPLTPPIGIPIESLNFIN